MKQTYPLDTIPSIISKLGVNSIQNYILTLGRALSGIESNPTKSTMQSIIDFGAEVLSYLLDKQLVVKETRPSSKSTQIEVKGELYQISGKNVVDIIPNIHIDQMIEAIKKEYPIRTNTTNKLKKDEILHSVDIASIGKSNVELLKQQNNIPLLVRSCNLKGSKRTPKNLDNASNPNYLLETKLVQYFIKDYDEQIIFMNHSFDRRGRLYTMSYPLSFQSDEFTRSSFELAFKQPINENGVVWLKRDIANLAGLDKHTHSRKQEWFEENKEAIIKVGQLGKIDKRLNICKELDKPIRFASACKAYVDYLESKPSGYMCSIDSTASGSQIMALLTRDEVAAKYTNLTNDKSRWDVYSEVSRKYYKLLGETNPVKYLADRKRFKQAVMITGYNGKVVIEKNFPTEKEKELFYKAYSSICKGAIELTEIINQAYLDNADKTYMSWIMPDGFQVCIPQFKAKWYRVVNKHFECMFKYEVIDKDIKANKRSLCPNFIHSVDSYICRELLRRLGQKDIEIMSVHDSFYSHPNNMSSILDCYNDILQDINTLKIDLVANFLTDIYGKKMANPFSTKPELDDIRFARYSLC